MHEHIINNDTPDKHLVMRNHGRQSTDVLLPVSCQSYILFHIAISISNWTINDNNWKYTGSPTGLPKKIKKSAADFWVRETKGISKHEIKCVCIIPTTQNLVPNTRKLNNKHCICGRICHSRHICIIILTRQLFYILEEFPKVRICGWNVSIPCSDDTCNFFRKSCTLIGVWPVVSCG